MMKIKAKSSTQRFSGEWFSIAKRGHLIACCDCGLVHRITHRIKNGRIQIRANRMNDLTRARRRSKHIKIIKKVKP